MYLVFPVFTAKPISLQGFNNTTAFLSRVLISSPIKFTTQKRYYRTNFEWSPSNFIDLVENEDYLTGIVNVAVNLRVPYLKSEDNEVLHHYSASWWCEEEE